MLSDTTLPRDKHPDELPLSDLDELVSGLGTDILEQIESAQDYHSINAAKKTASTLLEQEGVRMKDIYIDQGDCSGYDLETAFELMGYNCMIQERLDG